MSNEAKTISELDPLTSLTEDTVVAAEKPNSNGVFSTYSIPLYSLGPFLLTQVPGPYSNNSAAATANVAVGYPYYDDNGAVRIRLS